MRSQVLNSPRRAVPPSSRLVPFGNGVIQASGHLGGLGILWTVLLAILLAVLVAALVVVIIELLRFFRQPRDKQGHLASTPQSAPTDVPVAESPSLRILEERYARGELGQDEYLERKKDLTR
jgi:uncharacterized membrane protein